MAAFVWEPLATCFLRWSLGATKQFLIVVTKDFSQSFFSKRISLENELENNVYNSLCIMYT